jgi:hypothetical protein
MDGQGWRLGAAARDREDARALEVASAMVAALGGRLAATERRGRRSAEEIRRGEGRGARGALEVIAAELERIADSLEGREAPPLPSRPRGREGPGDGLSEDKAAAAAAAAAAATRCWNPELDLLLEQRREDRARLEHLVDLTRIHRIGARPPSAKAPPSWPQARAALAARLALEEPWQDYEDALREEEEEEDHMHWVVVADQLEQISDHGDNNDRDWRGLDSDMDSFDKAVADAKTRIDAWERSPSASHSPRAVASQAQS